MLKKETDKHVDKIPGNLILCKTEKIAEMLISLGEYSQCD